MINQKTAIQQLKEIKKYVDKDAKELRLAAEWEEDWKILIATILSAQTRDELTIDVCENKLFKKYKNLRRLANGKLSEIRKIIRQINYYKTKARNIRESAKIVVEKYKGKIPENIEELLELPGVGRKVANVYLVAAHNADAIGIDTHCARISRKLGWTKNKNPHKIEKDLEKLFPRRYWNSINWILVRFGRTYWTKKRDEDAVLDKIRRV